MAALSPAHFLLWTKLTTASPTPSVTPSEGTNQRTTVGVSSSTYPKHQSYLSVAPPPLPFFWTLSQQMYLCVCACVCICLLHACAFPAFCVWGLAQLAGSLSLSLPLFLPLSITAPLYPSALSPFLPPSSFSFSQVSGWGVCVEGVQKPAQGIQMIIQVANLAHLYGCSCFGRSTRCHLSGYTAGQETICCAH